MPLMEISVVPVGTGGPSVSEFVARVLDTLKEERDISYELTPMGTVVQADSVDRLFEIAKDMHESLFESEIKRVVTDIRIDERRDKEMTMDSKRKAVINKLEKG